MSAKWPVKRVKNGTGVAKKGRTSRDKKYTTHRHIFREHESRKSLHPVDGTGGSRTA